MNDGWWGNVFNKIWNFVIFIIFFKKITLLLDVLLFKVQFCFLRILCFYFNWISFWINIFIHSCYTFSFKNYGFYYLESYVLSIFVFQYWLERLCLKFYFKKKLFFQSKNIILLKCFFTNIIDYFVSQCVALDIELNESVWSYFFILK